MRLVLPTGDDGASRDYPLDGVLNLSRVTLNEAIELKRATAMDLPAVYRGLGALDKLIGLSSEEVLLGLSRHLELMEAYRALVWIARHRAGDRGPGGAILTVEQAVDFPFAGLDVVADPGDVPAGGVEPDPPASSADGGQETADGAALAQTPGPS